VSIDIAVKAPGSYTITFTSPAFLDDAGAPVTVGLDPITMVGAGTPTATRTATLVRPTATPTVTATPIGVLFTSITSGGTHTCGLTSGGVAYCWGSNSNGQLGNGLTGVGSDSANVSSPVPVTGGRSFTSLVAGGQHTCGLEAGGKAYCWGSNAYGQLGDGLSGNGLGSTAANRAILAAVAGEHTFTSLVSSSLGNHTCGLTSAGQAYCWGWNPSGQVGDGSAIDRSVPVAISGGRTFTSLVAGAMHSCGLESSGAAYCWGLNWMGQLGDGTLGLNGDGTTLRRLSPVAVAGTQKFASLAAGGNHTCGLSFEGLAMCWGFNDSGQIGDGAPVATFQTSFSENRARPVPVLGGFTFTKLAGASDSTCGLSPNGVALCWGKNAEGQVGDGTSVSRTTPVAVVGSTTFSTIVGGAWHACGLSTDGSAYCWGRNREGQLGDGTTQDRTAPVSVGASAPLTPTATATAPGGAAYTALVAGDSHT